METALKYELAQGGESLEIGGHTLWRVRALRDIFDREGGILAHKGDLGGWVESEANLSQSGECWVANEACVYGDAIVKDNALVSQIARAYEYATIGNDAYVCGHARIYGNALIIDEATVRENCTVFGNATISGKARLAGYTAVADEVHIDEKARCCGCTLSGAVHISGSPRLYEVEAQDMVRISGSPILMATYLYDHATVEDEAIVCHAAFFENGHALGKAIIAYTSPFSPVDRTYARGVRCDLFWSGVFLRLSLLPLPQRWKDRLRETALGYSDLPSI